jgi:ribosomal protein L6P/L9E
MLAASQIRELRPPNAYTGQGIRYSNEVFIAKPGKKKSS